MINLESELRLAEKELEQRNQKALELGIDKKAKYIAENLGKRYNISHGSNEYSYTSRMLEYCDIKILIDIEEAVEGNTEGHTKIFSLTRKEKPHLIFFKKPVVTENLVYQRQPHFPPHPEYELKAFKEESIWLEHFEQLYQKAVESVLRKKTEAENRILEEKIQYIKANHGFK
jgi:hypothetical protein